MFYDISNIFVKVTACGTLPEDQLSEIKLNIDDKVWLYSENPSRDKCEQIQTLNEIYFNCRDVSL